MTYSYDGIGQWAAGFAADTVTEGAPVRPAAAGGMTDSAAGEAFCGAALYVTPDGGGCTVQLAGLVTLHYTGTAPAAGLSILTADGQGGVKAAESGDRYWVLAVDKTNATVTFKL